MALVGFVSREDPDTEVRVSIMRWLIMWKFSTLILKRLDLVIVELGVATP